MHAVVSLPTLEELRKHVLQRLCAHDRLDPQQTALHEAVILRGGQPCGLYFQAEGPRLLRTHAVWASEESRVLFYDSTGQRFAEVRLIESPDVRWLANQRRAA